MARPTAPDLEVVDTAAAIRHAYVTLAMRWHRRELTAEQVRAERDALVARVRALPSRAR